MKKIRFIAAFIACLHHWGPIAAAQPVFKDVSIFGLKIRPERVLIEQLGLDRLPRKTTQFSVAEREVNAYYHRQGYLLAVTHLLEETDDTLRVYVDEGQLGKVIFHGLNTLDTVRIKYDFTLPHRIYNRELVEKELDRLKSKYGLKGLQAQLTPVGSYLESAIQLDREFDLPFIKGMKVPFFKKFGGRYDLEIFIVKEPSDRKNASFTYGLDLNYTKGFIPYARYRYPSLITPDDMIEVGASTGVYYGFDLDFTTPPRLTFIEAHSTYHFTPAFEDFFIPLLKGSAYKSHASRKDLGLSSYNYTLLKATADPGIVLLKRLKLYAGYGGERAFIYDSEPDPEADFTVDIREGQDYWHILEGMVVLDPIPWTLKRTLKRRFAFNYNYYYKKEHFHELTLKGSANYEFRNFDIYDFKVDFARLWGSVPFYHDVGVEGDTFKGLMGKGYYSRRVARVSNEYSISLYRDYIYGGIFVDGAWFNGSGYDLTGEQYAAAAGPGGHFIIFDQFEFNIYYGKDYLLPERTSQMNLYFNLHKKW